MRKAFGHPDDARLMSVVDADNKTWQYAYNTVGNLRVVTDPDGVQRTWSYNENNLLASERHPESGSVDYTEYGPAVC